MVVLPQGSDNWFENLKPFQKNHLAFLVREHEEMKAAEIWLSARGPQAGKTPEPFVPYDVFIDEIKKILSEHGDCAGLVKLLARPEMSKAEFTFHIAEHFGKKFGLAPALLVPPVALALSAIATVGLENWLALQEGASPG